MRNEGREQGGGAQLGAVEFSSCIAGGLCSGCGDAEGLWMGFEYSEHPFNEAVML